MVKVVTVICTLSAPLLLFACTKKKTTAPSTHDVYLVLDAVVAALKDRIETGAKIPTSFDELRGEVAERSGVQPTRWSARWFVRSIGGAGDEVSQGEIWAQLFDKEGGLLGEQKWPVITEDPKYYWDPQFAWDSNVGTEAFVPSEDSIADLLALMVYEYVLEKKVSDFEITELRSNPLYEDFVAQKSHTSFSFRLRSVDPPLVIVDSPTYRFVYPSEGWGSTKKVIVKKRGEA